MDHRDCFEGGHGSAPIFCSCSGNQYPRHRHNQTPTSPAESCVIHLLANLHITAAALIGPALGGRSELKMTSSIDRAAAAAIANDLARCLRLARAGLRPGPLPSCAIGAAVGLALCGRRFRAPLLAFIVVVEERALGADDPAAAVAVGLEAVLADQRTDPRWFELDRVKRIETCKLDIEFGSGVPVEQRQRALRRCVPFAIGRPSETADAAQLGLH